MPVMVAQYQIAETPEGLEKLLTRFAAYRTAVDQYIDTLREGIADGRTAPPVPVRKRDRADRAPGRHADRRVPGRRAGARRRRRGAERRSAAAVDEHIKPALQHLRDFLANEYEPHAMAEPGIGAVPDGQELYRLAIRMQTTVSTTPEEVHRVRAGGPGRIEAEKDEIAASAGPRRPPRLRRR